MRPPPTGGVARRAERGEPVRPEVDGHRIGGDDVEQADAQGRAQHRAMHRPPGLARLLRERCRRLESGEGQHGVHGSREHPADPGMARGGMRSAKDGEGVGAARSADQQRGEHQEDKDLEGAEDGAEAGRGAHAQVSGDGDHGRSREGVRPPQVRRVRGPLVVQCSRDREAQLQEQQRGDQHLHEDIAPADEEADGRMQSPRRVGGDRAGRGQLARQLGDAGGGEQAGHQGDQHGQRQAAAREGRAGRDGRGHRGGRRHRRDALEQDLA